MMIKTYTVQQAAEILGTSETPIRNAIHDKSLRASWRSNRWFITEQDLLEYAARKQLSSVIIPPQSRKDVAEIIRRYNMEQIATPKAGSPAYAVITSAPVTELALLTQGQTKLLPDGQRVDGMYVYKKGGASDGSDAYLYAIVLLDWPEDVPITTVPEGGEDND